MTAADEQIEPFAFAGEAPGPKFLVLGAIHGNETCGTQAIRRVIAEIESGAIKITKGKVTFVPVCNPRAYALNKRFTERNLNRYLVPTDQPTTYEARLGNILCPILEDCDVLLDIHSYTAGGPAFASVDWRNEKEKAFAAILGAAHLIGGWEEAYLVSHSNDNPGDPDESVGTGGYARRFGASAVTLECGQHTDPASIEVAYRAVRNGLRYLGLTDEAPLTASASQVPIVIVQRVYYREAEGNLARPWKNFERVKAGEVMATYGGDRAVTAPNDGCVVLPNVNATPGSEWFYFGDIG